MACEHHKKCGDCFSPGYVARLEAERDELQADLTMAWDALSTVKDRLLTTARGGTVDLGNAHTDVDVILQSLFNNRALRARK